MRFSHDDIVTLYRSGLSARGVARIVGCSDFTVRKILHERGVVVSRNGRSATSRCYSYVFRDEDGVVLYVGKGSAGRIVDHFMVADWSRLYPRLTIEVEFHESESEALEAEFEKFGADGRSPLFNVRFPGGGRPRKTPQG